MMNKLFFPLLAGMLLLASCADEELAPIIQFDELEIGAFPRLVSFDVGEYDLNDLGNTAVMYTVELVDKEPGSEIVNYSVFARYVAPGRDTTDEVQIRNIDVASLPVNENGFPQVTITIPSTEIVSTFGLNADNIEKRDRVEYRTTVTKSNGLTFGENNSSSAISNAFQGLLDFNAVYTCPLPDGTFQGKYNVELIDGTNSSAFGTVISLGELEVNPRAGLTTVRRVPNTLFPQIGGFSRNLDIEFTCDEVNARTTDTGLACDGGSIIIGTPARDPFTSFNFNDDSTFDVKFDLFTGGDGNCGLSPEVVTLRFTKV